MDTYLSLRVHLVLATKDRRPWLDSEWRSRLFACAATIVTRKGGRLLCAGSVRDHLHLYVEISATVTIAKLVGAIKSNTARWIRSSFPHRRDFRWEHGYAAFTISASHDESLRNYIRNQERRHSEKPVPDAYQAILDRHGIEYELTHASD
jgi:REP element-mobilizing transposase RayT